MRLCSHLRWKSLYGATFPDTEALNEALLRNDTPYSCLHTCQPWGPDDDAATPERCQPDRGCFQPSPKDPHRILASLEASAQGDPGELS